MVEDYTGTLGASRRVVVPVTDDAQTVVGLVAVGIRKSAVSERLRDQLPALLLAGLAAALLSGLGTALVSRRIRRQTHGLGERQLREMVEYYDAVLHAVTEGLLLTDLDGRLRLANDEAVRLLGLPDDARGRPVAELGLSAPLVAALTDGVAPRGRAARHRVPGAGAQQGQGAVGRPPPRVRRDGARPHRPRAPHR